MTEIPEEWRRTRKEYENIPIEWQHISKKVYSNLISKNGAICKGNIVDSLRYELTQDYDLFPPQVEEVLDVMKKMYGENLKERGLEI